MIGGGLVAVLMPAPPVGGDPASWCMSRTR
jgi:hypothetical protein